MNTNTTIALVVLVVAGLIGWFVVARQQQPARTKSPTVEFLENGLTPEKITRLEILYAGRKVLLEREPRSKEWSLPGKWPVREKEVETLVAGIAHLRTGFAALPLKEQDLGKFGLDKDTLTVKITSDGADHTLLLGDGPSDTNRFSRPTFLRLDSHNEVVRLAPGLIAQFGARQEFFQQRRLFPTRRVPKDADSPEKSDLLNASTVAVTAGDNKYVLSGASAEWQLQQPVTDRLDPDKLRIILTAFPDLWAEHFVDARNKKLEDFGLAKPEQEIAVTRDSGAVVKLLVGKQSRVATRKVTKMAPPPRPGQPPQPDREETVREEFSFAKLADNDQIFEVKSAHIKAITAPWSSLRDSKLVHFSTEEAQRLEIEHAGKSIVIVKDKGSWHLEKPSSQDAENSKVEEVISKLSGLQTTEFEDQPDAKFGLEKPAAVIKLTVQDSAKLIRWSGFQGKLTTLRLGTSDKDKSKIYVQVEGWPRINVLDDSLLKLIERPALAYRSRRLLDLKESDLTRIDIQQSAGTYSLAQEKSVWKLIAPVTSDVDADKVRRLTGPLTRLEAADFITESPTPEELGKVYGLEKPTVQATLRSANDKKTPYVLAVGKPRPDGKDEFYARLDQGPVFVVKKDFVDDLKRDGLAYRANKAWEIKADDISEIEMLPSPSVPHKEGQGVSRYGLQRVGKAWKIAAPFRAETTGTLAETLAKDVAQLKVQSFVKIVSPSGKNPPAELAPFGLDNPKLRVRVVAAGKERVLLLGSKIDKGTHAWIEGSDGIFIIDDKLAEQLQRPVFDYIDPLVLSLDRNSIVGLSRKMPGGDVDVVKKGPAWTFLKPEQPVDTVVINKILDGVSRLMGRRVAGYQPKDLAPFGLDKPAAVITFKITHPPGSKPQESENVIKVGKKGSDVFAAVDKGDTIIVLNPELAQLLLARPINFTDHSLRSVPGVDQITLIRESPGFRRRVVFTKSPTGWGLTDPIKARADGDALDRLARDFSQLRADELVVEKGDRKAYGLDSPGIRCVLGKEGKEVLDLIVGSAEPSPLGRGDGGDGTTPRRFAMVAGKDVIFLLSPDLSARIQQEFRDRKPWETFDAAQVTRLQLQLDDRAFTLIKSGNNWQVKDRRETKIETQAVTDTLDALARLKVERFQEDTKPNLQLYGLAPPMLKVTVELPQGSRVLLVGRKEGASMGSYATVADTDNIFVVSGADARRIARDLEDYVEKKK